MSNKHTRRAFVTHPAKISCDIEVVEIPWELATDEWIVLKDSHILTNSRVNEGQDAFVYTDELVVLGD